MENADMLRRWRLILGQSAEKQLDSFGGVTLSAEDLLMDSALSQIYGDAGSEGTASLTAGKGKGSLHLTRWLGDLRALFSPMQVQIIQRDAIERRGMRELLFEPEMLNALEPDIATASLLLMLKDQIPQRAKENARIYIQKIVERINRMLEDDLRRSVTAALNRRAHSPLPSAAALDFKLTMRRNLKNYDRQSQTILPEKFYFYERAARSGSRTVILDVDQSGSMGESVIYASVMGCILASIRALRTHIIAFNTEVHDLTETCSDPVDLLYGIQLGGGTDINKSIAYCEGLISEPTKTTLFLITDLCEGGNRAQLERRLVSLYDSGVRVTVLLSISDSGAPCYDASFAERLAAYGIPCFACPPEKLPDLLRDALRR
ncbi:MAG TPA: hypothetical protein DDX71_03945 [Ruminococcus sp.]|nr:hypothetical protein [Ruminococcus sp.]